MENGITRNIIHNQNKGTKICASKIGVVARNMHIIEFSNK